MGSIKAPCMLFIVLGVLRRRGVFMLLVSYGELIPMRLTHRYSGKELVERCQKKKARYEALCGGATLPMHVFVRHMDGQLEPVADCKIAGTCDAVARFHDRLRDDTL